MEAVILAGGRGTRLKPYTEHIPKPLVPVGEKPIIEILLDRMRKAGVLKVRIAVGHLAHLIMAVLGNGERFGMELSYAVEDEPLSTVGPIKAMSNLPETFLVANGDILTDLDLRDLYDHHLRSGAALTVATHHRSEKIDYGVLESDPEGRVTAFREKPTYEFTVSMGIYVFSRAVLEHVPTDRPFGFDELMVTLLDKRVPIAAYPFDGYWLDIGRPADYEIAQRDIDRITDLSD